MHRQVTTNMRQSQRRRQFKLAQMYEWLTQQHLPSMSPPTCMQGDSRDQSSVHSAQRKVFLHLPFQQRVQSDVYIARAHSHNRLGTSAATTARLHDGIEIDLAW
eukprot:2455427-Amphidinium_carterae.1